MAKINKRVLQRGSQAAIATIALLGILVVLNMLAARHNWRWDTTEERQYSLAPQTIEVLGQMQEPVTAIAFLPEGDRAGDRVRDLLKEYNFHADQFKYRVVDPERQPSVAKQYQINSFYTVILESGSKQRRVEPYNLFAESPDGQTVEFRGEQALTRGLLGLRQQAEKVLYFLQGHGEGSLQEDYGMLVNYLEGEGYTVSSLNLAIAGKVPENAAQVVVAGPTRDIEAKEVEQLRAYLDEGGKLLALMNPSNQEWPQWRGLLQSMGVELRRDVVVDTERAYFFDALTPLPLLVEHPITSKLATQKVNLVMPRTRSLQIVAALPEGLTASPLLVSSDSAWGETDLTAQQAAKDDQDVAGPLTMAVAVAAQQQGSAVPLPGNAPEQNQTPVAVVVGNASLIASDAAGLNGNIDFMVNTVNWLQGEESLLTIRPKTLTPPMIQLSGQVAQSIFYGTSVVIPVAILVVGAVVWWRRRAL